MVNLQDVQDKILHFDLKFKAVYQREVLNVLKTTSNEIEKLLIKYLALRRNPELNQKEKTEILSLLDKQIQQLRTSYNKIQTQIDRLSGEPASINLEEGLRLLKEAEPL